MTAGTGSDASPSPIRLVARRFWSWYESHRTLATGLAAFLFALQLGHLYWLTTDVVAERLAGVSYFDPAPWLESLLVFFDYTEIPAIVTASFVYIAALRRRFSYRDLAYLVAIDVQVLHLFWITDEFVVASFREGGFVGFPVWLAWVAILIDYLELPVIVETFRRFVRAIREGPDEAGLQSED